MTITHNATVSTDQAGARHRAESVSNINAGLLQTPPEIVWRIAELIEFYTDYVAFASTCRYLQRSLIPRRLEPEEDYYRTPWEWRLEADLHHRLSWEWQLNQTQKPVYHWRWNMPQPCFNLAITDPDCSLETIRSMLRVYEKRWPAALRGDSKVDFECSLGRALGAGRFDVFDLLLERGFPVQGKLQLGGRRCSTPPLATTFRLMKEMHNDDLRRSSLPLFLDGILAHSFYCSDKDALSSVHGAFMSKDVTKSWQGVMALVVRNLVIQDRQEPLSRTMHKVRYTVRSCLHWNLYGASIAEDLNYRELRELLHVIERPHEEEEEAHEEEEEEEEEGYYDDLRKLFQVEEQEEWDQSQVDSRFRDVLEAVNGILDRIVSGEQDSLDVHTTLPEGPAASLA